MKEIKFEQALEKLEKIVSDMENESITLEESLKKYEEGVKLARLCSKKLAEAEKKIEILTKTKEGKPEVKPFKKTGRAEVNGNKERPAEEDAAAGTEDRDDNKDEEHDVPGEGLLF